MSIFGSNKITQLILIWSNNLIRCIHRKMSLSKGKKDPSKEDVLHLKRCENFAPVLRGSTSGKFVFLTHCLLATMLSKSTASATASISPFRADAQRRTTTRSRLSGPCEQLLHNDDSRKASVQPIQARTKRLAHGL